MKVISFIFLLVFASNAFGVVTKNCPESIKLELRHFNNDLVKIQPDRDNPLSAFAYIEVEEIETFTEVLELRPSFNSECNYTGQDVIYRAVLTGSLRRNTKNPAVLKTYFTRESGELPLNYVGYSPVKSLDKNKTLVLESNTKIYYAGEDCNYGDCIPKHIRVGSAATSVYYKEGQSCFTQKEAQKIVAKKLNPTNWVDYVNLHTEEPIEEYGGEYFYDLDTEAGIKEYAKSFEWDGNKFVGDSVYRYTCAASVECWGGLELTCDGKLTSWEYGED